MPASLKLVKESLKGKKSAIRNVFAKWAPDNLYYKCHLIQLDEPNKKCLVRFEDDLEKWTDLVDIHTQLSLKRVPQDKIICTICEEGLSEAPNQIVICEVCEQGYHQQCHTPNIPDSSIDKPDASEIEIDWTCHTCSYIVQQQPESKKKVQPREKKIIVSIKQEKLVNKKERVTKGKNLERTRNKLVLGAEDGLKKVIPTPDNFEGENNPLSTM